MAAAMDHLARSAAVAAALNFFDLAHDLVRKVCDFSGSCS
jgi:hypothetical protein